MEMRPPTYPTSDALPCATLVESAAPLPGGDDRPYFRCHRLAATLSVVQCRRNRERAPLHDVLLPAVEEPELGLGYPAETQPAACWSCSLALAVEAGEVPYFTAEQVLRGDARAGSGPPPPGRPRR